MPADRAGGQDPVFCAMPSTQPRSASQKLRRSNHKSRALSVDLGAIAPGPDGERGGTTAALFRFDARAVGLPQEGLSRSRPAWADGLEPEGPGRSTRARTGSSPQYVDSGVCPWMTGPLDGMSMDGDAGARRGRGRRGGASLPEPSVLLARLSQGRRSGFAESEFSVPPLNSKMGLPSTKEPTARNGAAGVIRLRNPQRLRRDGRDPPPPGAQCARGSGRIWNFTAFWFVPAPPSRCQAA